MADVNETIELMETPAPHAVYPGGAYGFGQQLDSLANGMRVAMHGGSNRGWKAVWVAIPSRRAGLVVLTNSDRGPSVYMPVVCAWYRTEAKSQPVTGCR